MRQKGIIREPGAPLQRHRPSLAPSTLEGVQPETFCVMVDQFLGLSGPMSSLAEGCVTWNAASASTLESVPSLLALDFSHTQ